MIALDDGLMFGIGAFETIAVEDGEPQLLDRHVARLMETLAFFGIGHGEQAVRGKIGRALADPALGLAHGRHALKLIATPDNLIVQTRPNPYGPADYERGFDLRTSPIRRNETSPLTYRKTLNYGDNIREKRHAHAEGFDEPLFLNTRGEVAEGATTNIFFARGDEVVTPPVSCGLLPGVMRALVIERLGAHERVVTPDEIASFDAAFVTNALLGMMPVRSIDGHAYPTHESPRARPPSSRAQAAVP